VHADPDRLAQVVTNLLSNAIKFSPPDNEVVVAVEKQSHVVRISVRDHGPGIPPEFKPRVFEKFAQADATDARQKGGTGLGLSIVKQIVARLGGEVGFDDALGGGTIFHVELPCWDYAVSRDMDLDAEPDTPRVLFCEPDTAIALRERLRQAGYAMDFAYSAGDALSRAAATPYAAILVDLELPDEDGISLILRLRKQPQHCNTPIIVMSADPNRGRDDPRSSALNVLDWIGKPIDIDRLVRALDGPPIHSADEHQARARHILHVDDDRDMLGVVAQALAATADVFSADSIDEARRAITANRFDLAVLDVALGSASGLDLLSDLRDRDGHPIPVIVFSDKSANLVCDEQIQASLNKSDTTIDRLAEVVRDRLALRPSRTPEEVA
jgi:DNA-binding response OmpR family regulator